LIAGVDQVKHSIEGIAAPVRALQATFKELGEVMLAAFAVERVAHVIEQFAELGTQTQRTATLLGTTAGEVAGLNLLAQATGGGLEGMTFAFQRLGLALARADAGSEQARAALTALGLQAKDLEGLPLEAKLELLANKFSVIKDGVEKDAIAMALLGRAGASMIPIFNQGSDAIRKFA